MLRLVLLLALAGYGLALTRETVQRVVLLRTSGSDLAPAASGYTYRKQDDGQESVVHMGESEVMAQLASMYDGAEAPAHRVIPVREDRVDPVDGLADVDYSKLFDEHRASYGERPSDDYLDHFKRFKEGLQHEYGRDSAEDDKDAKKRRYGGGDANSYHNAKFESYSISGGHEKDRADGDAHETHDHGHRRGSHERARDASRGKHDRQGFHTGFDDSDHKDSHEYFGHKAFPGVHNYFGADGRGHKYSNFDDQHHQAKLASKASAEEGTAQSSEGLAAAPAQLAEAPAQPAEVTEISVEGLAEGKSYDYKIKH